MRNQFNDPVIKAMAAGLFIGGLGIGTIMLIIFWPYLFP